MPDWESRFRKFFTEGDPNDCWEWQGSRNKRGYGHFRLDGKIHLAHRIAWGLVHSPIPDGLFICHRCDNPPCVNYAQHLFIGTRSENVLDAVAKGRWIKRPNGPGEANGFSKLTEAQVRSIRARYKGKNSPKGPRVGPLISELAVEFGVHPMTIQKILVRKAWKHLD